MSSESATDIRAPTRGPRSCRQKKTRAPSYSSDSSGHSAPSALSDFKDHSAHSDPRAPSTLHLRRALKHSSELSDPSVPRYSNGSIVFCTPHDPSAKSDPRVQAITGSWHSRLLAS